MPTNTPRFAAGSWSRIIHGLSLGFFQPLVPVSIFVGLASILFDAQGDLVAPRATTFLAVALVPLVPIGLLIGLGLVVLGRMDIRDLGWNRPQAPAKDVAWGLVGLLVYLAIFVAVVGLLVKNPDETYATAMGYSFSARALFLLVGLHIAFVEETIFRGVVQPALILKWGKWPGIMATAILFAAWHPPYFHVSGFLIRLGLGLVTGMLRGEDRPLWGAFVAHACLWPVVGQA